MTDTQRMITQVLSLRPPQADSLDLLAKITDKLTLVKNTDKEQALQIVQEIAPHVKDFERNFPSVCFSIATGVGKTRLMGAFVAYLYLEKGIRNFFILSPNLTIYNKLIQDFTPNTPKYVLPGIQEFAINPPKIITGETYQHAGDLLDRTDKDAIRINFFNISKINSDKDSRGMPRIRSFSEYLGQSYFEYLSNLDDLVIIMDEAHRYRASAGMAAINELNPVLGLELTATAKSTGSKGTRFKNIVYDYPLAKAIKDKFVKTPAIVGRTDFNKNLYDEDQLQMVKLNDGLDIHETIKAELAVYSTNKKVRKVKPFVLVIAKNIEHAEELQTLINSDSFRNGNYKGKSIVVHSQKSGEEKDEVIERLLAVEKYDEPTEIVIHVDMLKEGWDVNNLYTIVPLKTADSKILVEQSIGRGLRLPYGEYTGVERLDRLHIIAHDRFNEIVQAAQNEQFEFQQINMEEDDITGKVAIENTTALEARLFGMSRSLVTSVEQEQVSVSSQPELPVFTDKKEQKVAVEVLEAIDEVSRSLNSIDELKKSENKEKLKEIIQERLSLQQQGELELEKTDYTAIIDKVVKEVLVSRIKIPRIRIVTRLLNDGGYHFAHFKLDTSRLNGLKPIPQELIVKDLIEGKRDVVREATFQDVHEMVEDYLLEPLINHTEINYSTESEVLYDLIKQVLMHLKTYITDELDLRKVLFFHGNRIGDDIFQQMQAHIIPAEKERIVQVDKDYYSFQTYAMLVDEKTPPLHFRVEPKHKKDVKSLVFEGFKKCLFQKQRFDSNTERQLAVLLEDETTVLKWVKLTEDDAKKIFDLQYTDPQTLKISTYCPDFIVETTDCKYIVETKASNQMSDLTVQEKTKAALDWCQHASDFEEKQVDGKNWKYLLIPHDTFVADRSFAKLVSDFEVKQSQKCLEG